MGIDSRKKKQALKAATKLKRLHGKKKLKRHVVDAFNEIRAKRSKGNLKKVSDINEDWEEYRKEKEAESDEDLLPTDMLDEDLDWEEIAFAAGVSKAHAAEEEDHDLDDFESKARRSAGNKGESYRELLPIKVAGRLVERRIAEEQQEMEDEDDSVAQQSAMQQKEDDFSNLSAADLLKKRKELLNDAKANISSCSCAVIADPQQNVHKLKELLSMFAGEDVHSLIRETVQKLAGVSLAQVFVDIIPGYVIRLPSETESEQKLKKETKKLHDYEQTLLRNYVKFLQLLEKNAMKLLSRKQKSTDETSFTFKMAMVSVNCFCRLLKSASHFNYATNIVSTVVRLSTCKVEQVVDDCCEALGNVFRNDLVFRISAFGARAIAAIVNQKKCDVSPKLLSTFLKLNIKEVDKGEKNTTKEKLLNKKFKLAKERKSKSKNKYAKQLSKLEADLKEAEAAESVTTKKKYATETMKHVFATYFRVLKRMPTTSLLEPVLEGISKFAHLLNIEFFDDLVSALESLVEQQHLHVLSSLHCVHAVFVILSGEGIAINIDPFRFYRSMYRLISYLPFERSPEVSGKEIALMLRTLEMMFIVRRKQVSLPRVAAFTKRLLDVSVCLSTRCAIAVLAFVRVLLLSHPRALSLVSGSEVISGGIFKPEIDDPDCCSALSSTIEPELKVLSKHENRTVALFANHIHAGLPSTGNYHLNSQTSTRKAYDWLTEAVDDSADETPSFYTAVTDFCKKQKCQLTSKNLQSIVCKWCDSNLAK